VQEGAARAAPAAAAAQRRRRRRRRGAGTIGRKWSQGSRALMLFARGVPFTVIRGRG